MKYDFGENIFGKLFARLGADREQRVKIRNKREELSSRKNEIHREFHTRQRRDEELFLKKLIELEAEIPGRHRFPGGSSGSVFERKYRRGRYRRKIGVLIYGAALLALLFTLAGFPVGFKIVFALVAVLSMVGSIAELFFYARVDSRIFKPIAELERAASEIARSNFGVRVAFGSRTEIDGLIGAFNMMAKSLEETEALKAGYEKNRKELVASISHDLKTPISSILGYVEAMSDSRVTDPERERRYLKIIGANAEYMNRLIDDLFLFSKLDMQKVDFVFEETALKPFMSDLMEEFALDLAESGAGFDYADDLDASDAAKLDAKRFCRVLRNIVDNAVKYGPAGKLMVWASARTEGGNLVVSIRDNGPGVPPEKLGRIFERFYRVDGERTKDLESTGLGLAIAKELVEAHGGSIVARDVESGGLEFTILIPLSERKEER